MLGSDCPHARKKSLFDRHQPVEMITTSLSNTFSTPNASTSTFSLALDPISEETLSPYHSSASLTSPSTEGFVAAPFLPHHPRFAPPPPLSCPSHRRTESIPHLSTPPSHRLLHHIPRTQPPTPIHELILSTLTPNCNARSRSPLLAGFSPPWNNTTHSMLSERRCSNGGRWLGVEVWISYCRH